MEIAKVESAVWEVSQERVRMVLEDSITMVEVETLVGILVLVVVVPALEVHRVESLEVLAVEIQEMA